MSTLEELTMKVAELRAEYARVGKPLLDAIVETNEQILDIKRERGELFYVEYMRFHCQYTEERDTLGEAKAYAEALEDAGNGYVKRIYGPGVELAAAPHMLSREPSWHSDRFWAAITEALSK